MPPKFSGGFSDAIASFLSTVGGGFETIMACDYLADEIAADRNDDSLSVRIIQSIMSATVLWVGRCTNQLLYDTTVL